MAWHLIDPGKYTSDSGWVLEDDPTFGWILYSEELDEEFPDSFIVLEDFFNNPGRSAISTDPLTGKIPVSLLPNLAITDIFVISSESEMLSLSVAQRGDVAFRTDLPGAPGFILIGDDYTFLPNWKEVTSRFIDWTEIQNKPSSFTPSTHNHNDLYYTKSEVDGLVSGGGGGSGQLFVYQPGGTASGNVFTSWNSLYAAASAMVGPKTILFDSSFLSANQRFSFPAGSYEFNDKTVFLQDILSYLNGHYLDFRSNDVVFTGLPSFKECYIDFSGRTAPLMTKEIFYEKVKFFDCQFIWDATTDCAVLSISKLSSAPVAILNVAFEKFSTSFNAHLKFIELSPNVTALVELQNNSNVSGDFAIASGSGGTILFKPDIGSFVESISYAGSYDVSRANVWNANFRTGSSTSAVAGSASALPATASGYLRVFIEDQEKLIPYFDPEIP